MTPLALRTSKTYPRVSLTHFWCQVVIVLCVPDTQAMVCWRSGIFSRCFCPGGSRAQQPASSPEPGTPALLPPPGLVGLEVALVRLDLALTLNGGSSPTMSPTSSPRSQKEEGEGWAYMEGGEGWKQELGRAEIALKLD